MESAFFLDNVLLAVFMFLPFVAMARLMGYSRLLKEMNAENTLKSNITGSLLVLAFLLSLALPGMEIYFRFFYNGTDSFSKSKASAKWFSKNWKTNNLGFRDDIDYELSLNPDKRRVTFIGDSFTAGHGVALDSAFFARIRARRGDLEIHSLSRPGNDTPEELYVVDDMVARGYQFDEVVLVYALNDIMPYSAPWRPSPYLQHGREGYGMLVTHSYFLNFIYWRYRVMSNQSLANYFSTIEQLYVSDEWEKQKLDLLRIKETVESHGGKFEVVIFPFMHYKWSEYPFGRIHNQVKNFWVSNGVPCLDLLDGFEKENKTDLTVNMFDQHPDAAAHETAAILIEPFLKISK